MNETLSPNSIIVVAVVETSNLVLITKQLLDEIESPTNRVLRERIFPSAAPISGPAIAAQWSDAERAAVGRFKIRAHDGSPASRAFAAAWSSALNGRSEDSRQNTVAAVAPLGTCRIVSAILSCATADAGAQRWIRVLARSRASNVWQFVQRERVIGRRVTALLDQAEFGRESTFAYEFAPSSELRRSPKNNPISVATRFPQGHLLVEGSDEARFVRMCNRSAVIADIHSQALGIEYKSNGGVNRLYFPDFVIKKLDGSVILVEIKPAAQWADSNNVRKWNSAMDYCHRAGWGFLITDGIRTPLQFVMDFYDEALSAALRNEMGIDRSLSGYGLNSVIHSVAELWSKLVAVCLKDGYQIGRKPLMISRLTEEDERQWQVDGGQLRLEGI